MSVPLNISLELCHRLNETEVKQTKKLQVSCGPSKEVSYLYQDIYLYGQQFQLVSDNKPLVHIFGDKKKLPEMAASRITRWSLFLSNSQYSVDFRPTAKLSNCDMPSRFPKSVKHNEFSTDGSAEVFVLTLQNLPIDAKLIARETKKDPMLSKVLTYAIDGWPHHISDKDLEFHAFWNKRTELS